MKFTDESKTTIEGLAKYLGTPTINNPSEAVKVFNGVSGAFLSFEELDQIVKSGRIREEYQRHIAYGIRQCSAVDGNIKVVANLDLNSSKGLLLRKHIEELGDDAEQLYFLIRFKGDNETMVALDIVVRENGKNN